MAETVKYLVIGNPARHSLSPAMQNAAFDFFGEGRPYSFRELTADELPGFAEEARGKLKGFNVTAPFKQAIIPLCDVVNEEAREADSVNTVKVIGGKLYGYTTDGYGFLEAMRTALHIEPSGCRFMILGAGGAAGAIARELKNDGAAEIMIVNRTREKAEKLAESVGGRVAAKAEAPEADCVINCTALGLGPDDDSPLAAALVGRCRAIFDAVYLPTRLQRLAREAGVKIADGRLMLLYQGARAFEIWTGHAAPLVKMQLALNRELEARK
ncbi:MAG: shikimate dehydrogenase [Victivallaceae bacterium]|nr:shikimate dehydrogenase [Victivallaceae bacterium]